MVRDSKTEKDLMELCEAAKKAAAGAAAEGGGGPEESRCLDALNQLKTFPVTVASLSNTKVGKLLRPLTKHVRKNIQALASEILTMWKDMFLMKPEDHRIGTLDNRTSLKARNQNVSNVKPRKKTNTTEINKVPKTETVDVNTVSEPIKFENIHQSGKLQAPNSMPKCDDPLRDRIRELLYEALCKVSDEAGEDMQDEVNASDPIQVALSVESVLLEKWGRSNGPNKIKYRSLLFNIKDAKNPDFRRKVLLGRIKPEAVVNLSTEEMASDARQLENEQIKQKALFECERGSEGVATTDQFKCGRCKQRKTTYYQVQTRSADEPMTTYITCVNCDNHWKIC